MAVAATASDDAKVTPEKVTPPKALTASATAPDKMPLVRVMLVTPASFNWASVELSNKLWSALELAATNVVPLANLAPKATAVSASAELEMDLSTSVTSVARPKSVPLNFMS